MYKYAVSMVAGRPTCDTAVSALHAQVSSVLET